MQSPRAKTKFNKASLPDGKTFANALEVVIKTQKELDKLEREISHEKAGFVEKRGKRFGKGGVSVAVLKTNNLKKLKKMSTFYTKAYSRIRASRDSSINGGFRQPLLVGEELLNFFRNADFGPLQGKPGNGSQRLVDALGFVNGSEPASRAILTSLFTLYAKRHTLTSRASDNIGKPADQVNHQLLGVDESMNRLLDPLLAGLERSSRLELEAKGKRDGDQKPSPTPKGKQRKYWRDEARQLRNWNDWEHVFDRRNFSYSAIQSIYSKGIDAKSLKADQNGQKTPYLVNNPVLGKAYMALLERAKTTRLSDTSKLSILGQAGQTPNDFVLEAIRSVPTASDADKGALALAAKLDSYHLIIQQASATYSDTTRKAAARKPKPKAKATA